MVIDQFTAAGFRVVALQRGPHLRTSAFVDDDELKTVVRDEISAGVRPEASSTPGSSYSLTVTVDWAFHT